MPLTWRESDTKKRPYQEYLFSLERELVVETFQSLVRRQHKTIRSLSTSLSVSSLLRRMIRFNVYDTLKTVFVARIRYTT